MKMFKIYVGLAIVSHIFQFGDISIVRIIRPVIMFMVFRPDPGPCLFTDMPHGSISALLYKQRVVIQASIQWVHNNRELDTMLIYRNAYSWSTTIYTLSNLIALR